MKRRPNINFLELGLNIGDTIEYIDGRSTAKVSAPKRLTINGNDLSFSRASWLASGPYVNWNKRKEWTHNGKTLEDMYNQTHS